MGAIEQSSRPGEAPGPAATPSQSSDASLRTRLRRSGLGEAFRAARKLRRDAAARRLQQEAARHAARLAAFCAQASTNPAAAIGGLSTAEASNIERIRAEGLLVARNVGWTAAAEVFARLPADAGPSLGDTYATALLRRGVPEPGLDLALPVRGRAVEPPQEAAARVIVYTALYHPGRRLPPLMTTLPEVRFICFTDRDIEAHGWTIVRRPAEAADPVRAEAFCRMRPHAILPQIAPEAEASLFVAAEMLVIGNLQTLLTRWLLAQEFALWRHSSAIDWRDLAERGLAEGAAAARKILDQAIACEEAGLPCDTGAWDTRVLWRRHASAEVASVMDAWWAEYDRAPGLAEIALCRVLQDPASPPAATPAVIPAGHGPAGDSICFAEAPAPQVSAPAVRPAGRRLPVAVIYDKAYASNASTLLRGEQLSALVARHHAETYEVSYLHDTAELRDHVLVLTKGALRTRRPQDLAALRKRNIALIASWDDDPPDAEKVHAVDAQMAVSIRQTIDMNRMFPRSTTYFVTHHVNPKLPKVTPPTDRLRTGYFGEPLNTHRPGALGRLVEINGIDTTKRSDAWMDAMHRYNCHWIIRRKQSFDGWKPQLKAFVAARCDAVAITARDDDDAIYYFGDDYPFYVRGVRPSELEADMVEFAAAFGGPEWRMAQKIMAQIAARSTDAHVAAEFRAMIDSVLA
jgi:hypothetical protein